MKKGIVLQLEISKKIRRVRGYFAIAKLDVRRYRVAKAATKDALQILEEAKTQILRAKELKGGLEDLLELEFIKLMYLEAKNKKKLDSETQWVDIIKEAQERLGKIQSQEPQITKRKQQLEKKIVKLL